MRVTNGAWLIYSAVLLLLQLVLAVSLLVDPTFPTWGVIEVVVLVQVGAFLVGRGWGRRRP